MSGGKNFGRTLGAPYLDALGSFEGFGRGDLLVTFTKELLDKVCDVTTSKGDVLDAAANDVTFSLRGKHKNNH